MQRHRLTEQGTTADAIKESVEFLANAPYPEVVRRLGGASLGLNTMQDEHFGINVVEFMVRPDSPFPHGLAGMCLYSSSSVLKRSEALMG